MGRGTRRRDSSPYSLASSTRAPASHRRAAVCGRWRVASWASRGRGRTGAPWGWRRPVRTGAPASRVRGPGRPPGGRSGSPSSSAGPVREAHGLAQVPRPVAGIRRLLRRDPRPGDVGDVGQPRRREAHAATHSRGKASRMGSIIGEWKACEVRSRRSPRRAGPAAPPAPRCASTRPGGHAQRGRVDRGERQPGRQQRRELRLRQVRRRASPPAGSACISRPRAATSASASSSEKTPARHAATYSPRLWPIMASGSTPQGRPELRQRVLARRRGRAG